MCGIVGVFDPSGQAVPGRGRLEAMTSSLRHRGPDGFGYYTDASIALGHARLAVIDLACGRQPLANEDGNLLVVFNGEIYNHAALQKELELKGHRFATRCDTEVLVHGYEEWGEALPERLDGMFTFAIWNREERSLFLARDRFGEKPLYTAEVGGAFFFASEPQALLLHPSISSDLDRTGLALYMAFDYIPHPFSIHTAIRKFPPASTLSLWEKGRRERRYWTLPDPATRAVPAEERSETFERLFQESVERRLVADVPVGLALSGGIDSAAVARAVARSCDPGRIRAYTIGFDDARYDESDLAKRTAEHFGIRHVHRRLKVDDVEGVIDDMLGRLDEPFADQSLLPTFLLSRTMREEVTVALGGDGGDELLGGYPIFRAHRAAAVLDAFPRGLVRLLEAAAPTPTPSAHPFTVGFAARRFLRGMRGDFCERQLFWHGGVTSPELARLFIGELPPLRDVVAAIRQRLSEDAGCGSGALHPINRATVLFLITYLVDDILHKVDRASMAVSLEFRTPFLEEGVAEFLWGLPPDQKATINRTKIFLRRHLRGKIPDEVLDAPKRGFGLPLSEWFRGRLGRRLLSIIESPELCELFDRREMLRILEEHRKGRDHRQLLWRLYVLGVFLRNRKA